MVADVRVGVDAGVGSQFNRIAIAIIDSEIWVSSIVVVGLVTTDIVGVIVVVANVVGIVSVGGSILVVIAFVIVVLVVPVVIYVFVTFQSHKFV